MIAVTEFLTQIHPSLGTLHGMPQWVFLLVVGLTLTFLLGYLIKGTQVGWQLYRVGSRVRVLRNQKGAPKPSDVAQFFRSEPLKHLWEEYADTLHVVRKAGSGDQLLLDVRATVPAEAMFTREVLVDSRLFDDFTRHLPGVLTGLGIIGTFAGLLEGLADFDPSSPSTAVSGLKPLMLGVEQAFLASGIAIGCAMLVVFISKFTLAYFYRLVEKLTHGIDSMYSKGAGEDYLARLVRASEQNQAHTAQLKQALVEDLKTMMTNLVDRQIAAHESATRALGGHLGETIVSSLADPLRRMGDAIDATARGNGHQVQGMLETLLTGFMQKLEDTFGGQIKSINDQMQKSMDSMSAVQASLQSLLADIKSTNEQATNQMSGKLEEAMKRATENQAMLTEQMREFVGRFRTLVTEEQAKSKQAMDEAVMKVLGEVADGMQALQSARAASANDEQVRSERLTARTEQAVGGIANQVNELLVRVGEQVEKTQRNIDVLGQVSMRAIDGMNQGASTMGTAASRFESAGTSVTTVFERSSKVADQLNSASATLQAAATAVQRGFEQYDATRRNVDMQIASLTGLIESAKKEAGVSKEIVASLKASADALRIAEIASREHLQLTSTALQSAFESFGQALLEQIKNAVGETDRHLSQGTGHLTGVVQELALAVHRMKHN